MSYITHTVGLSGGMGAGKSTLVPMFLEQGIPVLDLDMLVKHTYTIEGFLDDLENVWEIDREVDVKAQMAKIVTDDPSQLSRLEEIIGPWLEAGVEEFVTTRPDHVPFVVLDAPLLFEAKWHDICDFVISVICPREIREERVMRRPGMTREKMEVLMNRQVSDDFRQACSTHFVHTTGSVEDSRLELQTAIDDIKEFYKPYE